MPYTQKVAHLTMLPPTAREVVGSLRLLEATVQLFPDMVKDSTIQLTGDNQAAVLAMNQFRSRRAVHVTETLKKIFKLSVSSGFKISAIWQPRDLLEAEDLLSRQPDTLDWGIKKQVLESICAELKVSISLDLFASDSWHVSPHFVSLLYTPGCTACQALLLDWRLLLGEGESCLDLPSGQSHPGGHTTDRKVRNQLRLGSA